MATKKWTLDRKWDMSKEEKMFIDMLGANGFTVEGLKEYTSKTDYLIGKDGVSLEYTFPHVGGGKKQVQQCYKVFTSDFTIKCEYERLKAQIETR